jgi:hypothetical protein
MCHLAANPETVWLYLVSGWRDSIVSVAMGWMIHSLNPGGGKNDLTGSAAHPTSFSVGPVCSFPSSKAFGI